jgi:hypothetical protein
MATFNMDTLTIECFTNKKTYNKYLARKDPTMFQKNETFHADLRDNHDAIMEMISKCIQDPTSIPHVKMRETFNHLMIECLDVLNIVTEEGKEVREVPKDPDDVLFSQCEDLGIQPTNPIEYWKMQSVFKS